MNYIETLLQVLKDIKKNHKIKRDFNTQQKLKRFIQRCNMERIRKANQQKYKTITLPEYNTIITL